MSRLLAVCVLTLFFIAVHAQAPATATSTAPAIASIPPVAPDATAAVAPKPDALAATRAFMNRLQGEARAKSDAYMEGGYWLLLWDLLYGLVVA